MHVSLRLAMAGGLIPLKSAMTFFLRLVTHLPAPLIPGYKNLKMIIIKSSDVLWCRLKYFSWRFCFWPWILSLWCFSHSFTSWAGLHGPVLALVAAGKWGVADTTKKSWPQLLNTLQGPRARAIVLVWTSQRILSGTKADKLLSGYKDFLACGIFKKIIQ